MSHRNRRFEYRTQAKHATVNAAVVVTENVGAVAQAHSFGIRTEIIFDFRVLFGYLVRFDPVRSGFRVVQLFYLVYSGRRIQFALLVNIAKPLMITRTQLSVNSTLIVTKYGSVTILARFSADFRTLKNPPKLAKTRKKLETVSKFKKKYSIKYSKLTINHSLRSVFCRQKQGVTVLYFL